jgi:hypothetical protein
MPSPYPVARRVGRRGLTQRKLSPVIPGRFSQHILETLELPDFEIDFSLDSGADQETNAKALV